MMILLNIIIGEARQHGWIPPPSRSPLLSIRFFAACARLLRSLRKGATQVPNSPFLFAVTRTACDAGSGRVSDAGGACVCPEGTVSFSPGGACVPSKLIIAAVLLPVAALAVAAWLARRLLRRPAEEGAEELRRAVQALRRRLLLTRREGVVVTSDWLPVWGHQAHPVVFIQQTCLVSHLRATHSMRLHPIAQTHVCPAVTQHLPDAPCCGMCLCCAE